MKQTPRDFIRMFAVDKDTKLRSTDPSDSGNWYNPSDPKHPFNGQLIGSKYGVTGAALQEYLGRRVNGNDIVAVTEDFAADLGYELFYKRPKLNRLPWNRVTASMLDFCYGAGVVTGIKQIQSFCGTKPDGVVGAQTLAAYKSKLSMLGEAEMALEWGSWRNEWYKALGKKVPRDQRFVKGWINRSDSWLPNAKWWVWACK